jgi:ribokinase
VVTEGLEDVVAMDRTGAGDAFAGAMIGSLVRGAGLLEAVAAGNRAGSRAVARLGAVGEMSLI